jgi:hypothetical protein
MENPSALWDSLLTIAAAVLVISIVATGGFLAWTYFAAGKGAPLFKPRYRRLSFIERAHLDGGRKLLLIRRDDVEHLVMIGGPIDIVVETGINWRPQVMPAHEFTKETGPLVRPQPAAKEEAVLELTQPVPKDREDDQPRFNSAA